MSEQELKPCPFCGDAAFDHAIEPHEHHMSFPGLPPLPPSTGSHVIECGSCEVGMIADTKEAVFAAWNRRAALASAPATPAIPSAQPAPEALTGNPDADAALVMLDRLDVAGEDDARVDAIAAAVRRLAATRPAARPDQQRADFEAWASSRDGLWMSIARLPATGVYRTDETRAAWDVWQAAQSAAPASAPVGDRTP